jgi:type III pantothenate kinase
MNLAIDIGNSFIHTGVFDANTLCFEKKIDAQEKVLLKKLLNDIQSQYKINRIGIASVNNKLNSLIAGTSSKIWKLKPIIINNKSKLPIIIKVKNSGMLGADRICNAVYGHISSMGKYNSLVVDLGTANTYDLVLKNGSFIGGIIAPGIYTSAMALNANTAQLPKLNPEMGRRYSLIGNNTYSAISSGLINYMKFASEGIVSAVKKQYPGRLAVYLTGGSAEFLLNNVNFRYKYVKNTVLEGLNMILNRKP